MPSNVNLKWGPVHNNSNVMCAIDIRVGGENPDTSDLLEIAFLPVNHSYKVHPELKMFNVKIRPSWPVDKKIAKLNAENINEFLTSSFDSISSFSVFEIWVENMSLKLGKKIIPLVWDWPAVKSRLVSWMGQESFDHYIMDAPRDVSACLNFLNDRFHFWGEDQPFKQASFAEFLHKTDTKLIERNSVTANAMGLMDSYRKILGTYIAGYKGQ